MENMSKCFNNLLYFITQTTLLGTTILLEIMFAEYLPMPNWIHHVPCSIPHEYLPFSALRTAISILGEFTMCG